VFSLALPMIVEPVLAFVNDGVSGPLVA